MDRIESQVNALIRAIQSDERYLRYQTCRKSLENYPELMERIFSLRRDVINYNRMTENPSLNELGAQFGERYEELQRMPGVVAFLEAEEEVCRLLRSIDRSLCDSIDMALPD